MIEPIKIDNEVYFDPYTSCIYFQIVPSLEERKIIKNKVSSKMLSEKKMIINTKLHYIKNINIIPTMQFQGNCLYCYNSLNNNELDVQLDVNTLHKTVVQLMNNNYYIKANTVSFYGGEPFLNRNIPDIIDYLIDNDLCTKDVLINISSSMLYDDETFNQVIKDCIKIKEKNIKFYISITIDFGTGDKNYTRISNKNKNINKQEILNRANILRDNNINVTLSTIVSASTDIDQMAKEVIEHYNSIKYKQDEDSNSIYNKFAYRFAAVHNNELLISNKKIDALFDFISTNKATLPITPNMFPYMSAIENSEVTKLSDNIYLLLQPPTYCGIYSRSLVIMPDGKIAPCQMDPYNNEMQVKENTREHEMLFDNMRCNRCDYYLMCRSGCLNITKATTHTKALDSYCYFLKRCIDFSVKNSYDANKDFKLYLDSLIYK